MQTDEKQHRPLGVALANSGRKWVGEVAHVALLYEQLAAQGHRPWIVCRRGFALHQHAEAHSWNYLALHFSSEWRPWRDWQDIQAWTQLVLQENLDILHCHRGKEHWLGVAVARRTGRPLVRTRHVMTPVGRHPGNRWLYLHATDAVLSVSQAVRAGFGPWSECLPHGLVIPSAISTHRFDPQLRSNRWRRENAAPFFRDLAAPEPLWFGLIGRFQRVKGQRIFMEAAAQVAARCPEAHFVMAGAGGRHLVNKWRERFAGPHGFSERVLVLDLVENLPELLASLDVGVIASLGSEGFSRIALEMLASGLPLVSTVVGGIPELLESSHAARLVRANDAVGLAEAMLVWAADPTGRVVAGNRGREYVLREHKLGIWAERIIQVYRDVLAARTSDK